MKSQWLLLFFISILIASCGEEIKPEDALKEFAELSNTDKELDTFVSDASGYHLNAYTLTRKYAEKLNIDKIKCEQEEEEAFCECETKSGKKRKFHLVKEDENWKVDLTSPELTLEIFHILYSQGMVKEAIPFATQTEKDRLKVFLGMVENMEIPVEDRKTVPFDIKCKEFKKKYECICLSEEGESSYVLFKTSKGWKAELGESKLFESDTMIDYNSSEEFNLNQHDLDSLTDLNQKLLDSMLSL